MKMLAKLLTFWIPIKKWRKKLRAQIQVFCGTYAILKKLQKKYPNSLFFVSPHAGIGELTQSLCLMKEVKDKTNKNIVIITKKKTEQSICNLFKSVVSVCYIPDFDLAIKSEYPVNPDSKHIYSMCLFVKKESTPREFDIALLKDYLHLEQNSAVLHIVPSRPQNTDSNFASLEKLVKNNKTILLCPEANTYDSDVMTKSDWIKIASALKQKGFHCIFNANEQFAGFQSIFLPIDQMVYIAHLINGIVSFRSGFSELLAITTTCPMILIYPNGTTHLFKKKWNISINQHKERLKQFPILLKDGMPGIQNTFVANSIALNFERDYAKDFYYDFNLSDLIGFITKEFEDNINE